MENTLSAPSATGSKLRKNIVTGIGSALIVNQDDISLYNEKLARGSIVYNETTKRLTIATGEHVLSSLPDHCHEGYAKLGHSHITSANEVWRVSEPRLWYTDDLDNHPELVPLDGREIPDDRADMLQRVYPGCNLLTHPCTSMGIHGFENDTMTLSVKEFQSDFAGGRLSGEVIDETNNLIYIDQWLTNSTDVNEAQTVTITFKGGHTYAPTEYWMIPAAGISTAPFHGRPTPRDWKLEGSTNNGTTWEVVDERSEVNSDEWQPLTIKCFTIDHATNMFNTLRLTITKWNGNTGEPLETGLRRFWVFGRKNGVFTMPTVESPSPAFSWVVPYRDLNIGMKNEAVGDVGLTTTLPELLPKSRLRANGESYFREGYPELFNHTGFTQDHETPIRSLTQQTGSVLADNKWEDTVTDTHQAKYIEIIPAYQGDDVAIGGYALIQSNKNKPVAWLLEGFTEEEKYEVIQDILNVTPEDMEAQNYRFYLDKTIKDKKYSRLRFTFTEWSTQNAKTTIQFKIFAHKMNEFYIPNITVDGSDNCYAYVIANNTAQDVSSEVVAKLQRNVADLLETVSDLQAKLNELDPRMNVNNVNKEE